MFYYCSSFIVRLFFYYPYWKRNEDVWVCVCVCEVGFLWDTLYYKFDFIMGFDFDFWICSREYNFNMSSTCPRANLVWYGKRETKWHRERGEVYLWVDTGEGHNHGIFDFLELYLVLELLELESPNRQAVASGMWECVYVWILEF